MWKQLRASIQQSPKRSARKHAMALGISSRSLRRILHADLKLRPYKMMLAQELSERDHVNRRAVSAEILEQVSPYEFFLWGYLKEKVFKQFYNALKFYVILCTFQKYIQFFSRRLLSFFIPLQNVRDLSAPPCISSSVGAHLAQGLGCTILRTATRSPEHNSQPTVILYVFALLCVY